MKPKFRPSRLQPAALALAACGLACLLGFPIQLLAADPTVGPAAQTTNAAAPLLLLYSERPPFMHKGTDERVTGLAVDAALRAFAKAGIAVTLREASPTRRLLDVKENRSAVCSLGFYATDERRKFSRISHAVSQDGPMVALSSAAWDPSDSTKIEAFLANPELRVLVKDAIVYGPYMEAQFARMQAQRVATQSEYPQLLTLLRAQRAHVLFMPQEEANHYLQNDAELAALLRVSRFATMPPGETRHVLCSMQVSEDTMARLDRALRTDPKVARLKP